MARGSREIEGTERPALLFNYHSVVAQRECRGIHALACSTANPAWKRFDFAWILGRAVGAVVQRSTRRWWMGVTDVEAAERSLWIG